MTQDASYVYFALSEQLGAFKVGFSKDPRKRITQIASGQPYSIQLWATINGNRDEERAVHWLLRHWKEKNGTGEEWFTADKEVFSILSDIAANGGPPAGITRRAKILSQAKKQRWMARHELRQRKKNESNWPKFDMRMQSITLVATALFDQIGKDDILKQEMSLYVTDNSLDIIRSTKEFLSIGRPVSQRQMNATWCIIKALIQNVYTCAYPSAVIREMSDSCCFLCYRGKTHGSEHPLISKKTMSSALNVAFPLKYWERKYGKKPSAKLEHFVDQLSVLESPEDYEETA